jgi:ubiquinone/menaquinone biosynthesis C-methylase UbiE
MSSLQEKPKSAHKRRRGLRAVLESKKHQRQPFNEYRRLVQHHYDGFAGKLTSFTGILTGHAVLAGRVFHPTAFDIRGCKRILDAGCGNGRYSRFLLRRADAGAVLTAFDLSSRMLRRAEGRLRSPRVSHVVADLTRLPYAEGAFDAVVCGWVLEHLPDPGPGLRELARVTAPGGRLLLLCTEDTLTGAWCSRLWHCRTYNRDGLRERCAACGLRWERELWFSPLHRWLRLGGIIVELRKGGAAEQERAREAVLTGPLRPG